MCSGEIDGVREDTVLGTPFVMLLVLVRILFVIVLVIFCISFVILCVIRSFVFRISGLFEATSEDSILVDAFVISSLSLVIF